MKFVVTISDIALEIEATYDLNTDEGYDAAMRDLRGALDKVIADNDPKMLLQIESVEEVG